MFDIESQWVGDRLAAYPAPQISPLLNVGSSTAEFRERAQPWTERNIFTPLHERGVEIVHLDSRAGAGIDIRADLLDEDDFARIGSGRYRALLCCNILEHVRDPGEFASQIIDSGESYRDTVCRRPWILLRHLARLPFPFVDFEKWRASMQKPYWLFHNYQVSAAVLRRYDTGERPSPG